MDLRRRAVRIALLAPALSACRTAEEAEPRVFVQPGVDWSRYSVVYLEEATISTTAKRSEKADAILRELKLLAEISLSDALTNSGRFERVVSRKGEIEPGRTLVCRCAMKVHFGSTALRVTLGFGAGRSGLWMTPSLHDAETGERLLSYRGWGGSFQGWGADVIAKMQADVPAIAE
ncbi:MAG TPA: DUF4410 domain-containing protein, partial [Planctomycetota bacterium]|nr:DUF4410 domain-containing protein [Planctomycetota bacterium]